MSLLILKLSGSSTSDSFVPLWHKSLNSLKIQSWYLTTWNAEENPNCHGASVSSAGISCVFRSDWLLECGRDSGSSDSSVSPFCTRSVHAVSTPDCLFVEQLREQQSRRGAKIPSSTSHFFAPLHPQTPSLDNSIVQTFLGWTKFTPRTQKWPPLFCGI